MTNQGPFSSVEEGDLPSNFGENCMILNNFPWEDTVKQPAIEGKKALLMSNACQFKLCIYGQVYSKAPDRYTFHTQNISIF
jgi:hypothetical protein